VSARGSATGEYVAAILAVGLLMLALLAVRPHQPERRPPIDPVREVGALVRPAPVPRVAAPRATAAPRPRRTVRRPSAPPRPTVLVPGWATGW
jgi:hypothetical protein